MKSSPARLRRVAHVLSAATVGLVATTYWLSIRHLFPGQWVGDTGFFALDSAFLGAAFGTIACYLAALAVLISTRRFVAAVLLTTLVLVSCVLPSLPVDPSRRYLAELPRYKRAIESGQPYGDQHRESVDGRTLTYWRWKAWGIDNAVGVVHDPQDRLMSSDDEERSAFKGATGGIVHRAERFAPGWYFVSHS